MDPAECLEGHEPCTLQELLQTAGEEEVVVDDGLTLLQFQSGALKVKIDIKVLDELCDWVSVRIRLLINTKTNFIINIISIICISERRRFPIVLSFLSRTLNTKMTLNKYLVKIYPSISLHNFYFLSFYYQCHIFMKCTSLS
jgi:hypothetical protein